MPPDQYELYAEFGIASEKAQLLEIEAGNYVLAFLGIFFKPDKISNEQRDFLKNLIDDMNHATLGKLLKSVKGLAEFDESFLKLFDAALEQRNYLAHHFFRSHNFAIYSADGRKVMIEELKSIQRQLDIAHASLSAASTCLNKISGLPTVTDEQLKKWTEQGKRVGI